MASCLSSLAACQEFERKGCWNRHSFNRQHYEGVGLAICAATYAFHLTRNHPFVDGNKRVAAAVAEIFLRLNGARLSANNDEIFELFMGIAAGNIPREEVEQAFVRWIEVPS